MLLSGLRVECGHESWPQNKLCRSWRTENSQGGSSFPLTEPSVLTSCQVIALLLVLHLCVCCNNTLGVKIKHMWVSSFAEFAVTQTQHLGQCSSANCWFGQYVRADVKSQIQPAVDQRPFTELWPLSQWVWAHRAIKQGCGAKLQCEKHKN